MWIKNDTIREFATKAISILPSYFYIVAASSTGKYHPKYALGDGGLVRHTKAAVAIANDLLSLEMYGKFTQDEKDLILVSLILHDGMKHGEKGSTFTVAGHPTIMAAWIAEHNEICDKLSQEQVDYIKSAISSHMGQWNTDYKSKKEILPKPKTAMQKFVHQCDYLASRKYLEFDFGDVYYNPVTEKEAKPDYKDDAEQSKDILQKAITKIVNVCKEKIEAGTDRNSIYEIIKTKNGGNRNPNSVKDDTVAREILTELEKLI